MFTPCLPLIAPVILPLIIQSASPIIIPLVIGLGLLIVPFVGMSVISPKKKELHKEKEPRKKHPKSFGEKYGVKA